MSFFQQILFPVIYCTIVYFMTDQPSDGLRYTQFLSITILTCLVAQSIGLLIGTVAPSLPVSFRNLLFVTFSYYCTVTLHFATD